MKHLLADIRWKTILRRVHKARLVVLFLDYDGTLVPIRQFPHLARLSLRTRKALRRLSKNGKLKLCLISGRSLTELKKMVGLKNIIYVGNHGLQIEDDSEVITLPKASKIKRSMKAIFDRMRLFSKNFPGFWAENKGLTISLHYRRVPERLVNILFGKINNWFRKNRRGLKLTEGKKVWELRPRTDRDKAWAVRYISRKFSEPNKLEMYFGDDTTDQKALELIKGQGGVAVRVGNKELKGAAFFQLKTPGQVTLFLERLSGVLPRKSGDQISSLARRTYVRKPQ